MDKTPSLKSFLEDAEAEGRYEATAGFSVNSEKRRKFYANLLEEPQEGILMLLQSAQRLGSEKAEFRVGRSNLKLHLTLSAEGFRLVKECLSAQWFERDLPPSHPCFELRLGLSVLKSNYHLTKLEANPAEQAGSLELELRFASTGSFLVLGNLRARGDFTMTLQTHTLCAFPVSLDGRSLLETPINHSRTEKRFKVPFFFWHTPVLGLRWRAQTLEGREPAEGQDFITLAPDGPKRSEPVFLNCSSSVAEPSAEFYADASFFSGGKKCQLIPVRFGVTLAPSYINRALGYNRCFFAADHLEVDASSRKLIDTQALRKTISETAAHLEKYEESIRECLHLYAPCVTATEALKSKLLISSAPGATLALWMCMATAPWNPLFPLVAGFAFKSGLLVSGMTLGFTARRGLELEKLSAELEDSHKRVFAEESESEPLEIFLDP